MISRHERRFEKKMGLGRLSCAYRTTTCFERTGMIEINEKIFLIRTLGVLDPANAHL